MPLSVWACIPSGVGSIWPGSRLEADVQPVPDLLALALGDAEHARDDLNGEGGAEVGDCVEGVGVVELAQERDDDLADHRLQRTDGSWA